MRGSGERVGGWEASQDTEIGRARFMFVRGTLDTSSMRQQLSMERFYYYSIRFLLALSICKYVCPFSHFFFLISKKQVPIKNQKYNQSNNDIILIKDDNLNPNDISNFISIN